MKNFEKKTRNRAQLETKLAMEIHEINWLLQFWKKLFMCYYSLYFALLVKAHESTSSKTSFRLI